VDSSSPFRVITGRGTPTLPLFTFPTLPLELMHPTSEKQASRKFVYAILHSPGPIRAVFSYVENPGSKTGVRKKAIIPHGGGTPLRKF
jgi:hypothetical protein